MHTIALALLVVSLLTVLASTQPTSPPVINPPIIYNALGPNTTVVGSNTITVFCTTTSIFGSLQTLTVGQSLKDTVITASTCPPNFIAGVNYGDGIYCMYCPSPGPISFMMNATHRLVLRPHVLSATI